MLENLVAAGIAIVVGSGAGVLVGLPLSLGLWLLLPHPRVPVYYYRAAIDNLDGDQP